MELRVLDRFSGKPNSKALESTQKRTRTPSKQRSTIKDYHLSDSEIRRRVREHLKSSKVSEENTGSKSVEKDAKEELENIPDIGKNDPKSLETQKKLSQALKMGSFHFNEKERAVLSEILNKD